MAAFDIITAVKSNKAFRRVLDTQNYSQLVVMNLLPGEDIGWEQHENDQFFAVVSGIGIVVIGEEEYSIQPGFATIIPSRALHNIINTSKTIDLGIYVIYSPPHHPPNEVQEFK